MNQTRKTDNDPHPDRITVVGMGMAPEDLSLRQLRIIEAADVLVGAKRHLAHFENLFAEKIAIGKDLEIVMAAIADRIGRRRTVVLASGDPLFFGIGATLIRRFGSETVRVLPNVSSLAAAFSRLNLPWHPVPVVHFHGTDATTDLIAAICGSERVFVLTDPHHTPDWIAARLLEFPAIEGRCCVLERLGEPDETMRWMSLKEASAAVFRQPNVIVIEARQPADSPQLWLGMPETAYLHDAGMITKPEIRAVSIAQLALMAHHVVWDLGAGSGSVSIEAALLAAKGQVIAVEQHPERVRHIRENVARFCMRNIRVIQGAMPGILDGLPAPDRVFVGGGGKDLDAILHAAGRRLADGGIMVVNTVLLQSLHAATAVFRQLDWPYGVTQLQANVSKSLANGERFDARNPVWLVQARKEPDRKG
ncbi:precorrin-6y C5,15-methyltransferase (decarboxylating) subunit CbiE [Desulfatirhabdium butyrativorans]|uniref:precorrin-6y C5,15-methyltransferase (decarboxylating) subunit CbiE n=1 Tax=Desulfatirhabdium butyrativorans TaxID=340467 RepID=UPI0003F52138|nr:precorrin-6y C5,15-methyltransferase (decarboxylating) subunit CbiE [Desulfatirhabdium butyrativorans]